MGITGLLPFVKDACIDQVHLSDLSNTVAVIDTYGWLHRSLIGACYEIYKGAFRSFFNFIFHANFIVINFHP